MAEQNSEKPVLGNENPEAAAEQGKQKLAVQIAELGMRVALVAQDPEARAAAKNLAGDVASLGFDALTVVLDILTVKGGGAAKAVVEGAEMAAKATKGERVANIVRKALPAAKKAADMMGSKPPEPQEKSLRGKLVTQGAIKVAETVLPGGGAISLIKEGPARVGRMGESVRTLKEIWGREGAKFSADGGATKKAMQAFGVSTPYPSPTDAHSALSSLAA